MMDHKDIFIGKAQKYNCYIQTDCAIERSCINCQRWRLSFPYTCDDYDTYGQKAETCLNYTEDKRCPVD